MTVYFTLRELLRNRGIHNELKFAKDLQIRHGTLYDICNNRIERVPVHVIDKICSALECEPGDWIKHKKMTDPELES